MVRTRKSTDGKILRSHKSKSLDVVKKESTRSRMTQKHSSSPKSTVIKKRASNAAKKSNKSYKHKVVKEESSEAEENVVQKEAVQAKTGSKTLKRNMKKRSLHTAKISNKYSKKESDDISDVNSETEKEIQAKTDSKAHKSNVSKRSSIVAKTSIKSKQKPAKGTSDNISDSEAEENVIQEEAIQGKMASLKAYENKIKILSGNANNLNKSLNNKPIKEEYDCISDGNSESEKTFNVPKEAIQSQLAVSKTDKLESLIYDTSDSDSAPEEITFNLGREEAAQSIKTAIKQAQEHKEQLKKKRRDIHGRNIMQKEEKRRKLEDLESKMLSDEMLELVSKLPLQSSTSSKPHKETFQEDEASENPAEIDQQSKEDDHKVSEKDDGFISLCGPTEFQARVLNKEIMKPVSVADDIMNFKQRTLYGDRIKREPTQSSLAYKVKQAAAGKLGYASSTPVLSAR